MKKSYKEILILLLEAKNKAIKEHTSLNYITSEDIKDVSTWKEKICKKIVLCIKDSLMIKWKVSDISLCPWCLVTYKFDPTILYLKEACGTCSYGKRNGKCLTEDNKLNKGSLYHKITNSMAYSTSISSIPYVVEYMREVLKLLGRRRNT